MKPRAVLQPDGREFGDETEIENDDASVSCDVESREQIIGSSDREAASTSRRSRRPESPSSSRSTTSG